MSQDEDRRKINDIAADKLADLSDLIWLCCSSVNWVDVPRSLLAAEIAIATYFESDFKTLENKSPGITDPNRFKNWIKREAWKLTEASYKEEQKFSTAIVAQVEKLIKKKGVNIIARYDLPSTYKNAYQYVDLAEKKEKIIESIDRNEVDVKHFADMCSSLLEEIRKINKENVETIRSAEKYDDDKRRMWSSVIGVAVSIFSFTVVQVGFKFYELITEKRPQAFIALPPDSKELIACDKLKGTIVNSFKNCFFIKI